MPKFEVVSDYQPSGDQPEAIAALAEGIENGLKEQILLGVTGSGKTFTMAKVIEKIQRPTLVLAHNKTLAAQLCADSVLVSSRRGIDADEPAAAARLEAIRDCLRRGLSPEQMAARNGGPVDLSPSTCIP